MNYVSIDEKRLYKFSQFNINEFILVSKNLSREKTMKFAEKYIDIQPCPKITLVQQNWNVDAKR